MRTSVVYKSIGTHRTQKFHTDRTDMLPRIYSVRKMFLYKLGFIIVAALLSITFSGYILGSSSHFLTIQNLVRRSDSFTMIQSQSMYFENMAVIVEFRSTPLLVTIIFNVMQNIPKHWPIQIFHCKSNADYIKNSRLSRYIQTGKIILTELNDFKGNFNHFNNALFTNVTFWNKIRGEKVLFFQIDSAMCSNSPHKITDYLQYDFVGAPWKYQGLRVGNGGFSLRSKNKTLTLIQNMRSTGMRYSGEINEDLWYATYFSTVGLVAPSEIAKTFAVESIFYENPLAVHKLTGLGKQELKKICEACPDAYLVPPYCNA